MSELPNNFRIVLHSRPGESNEPDESNFRHEETPYPDSSIEDGYLIIKNLYLSLDPALRSRLNDDTGVDYIKPLELENTVEGFGGIGQVVHSNAQGFETGSLVVSPMLWPWKKYFTIPASNVRKISQESTGLSPTLHLSLLGLTGLTAYLAIKEKGHISRGANQTMVVSTAAGSTGSFAGQIAKALGCGRVVGTCGSEAKMKCVVEELGFDAAINYKTESVADRLKALCPEGVDIYFDNVGGEISNEVIRQMKENSHVILCGQISAYNNTKQYPPPIFEEILTILDSKKKVKETIETGLENAGKAFVSMMRGGNIGKQLLKL